MDHSDGVRSSPLPPRPPAPSRTRFARPQSLKSRAVVVALALAAVLLGAAECDTTDTGLPADGSSGAAATGDTSGQLAGLTVAAKGSMSGYSREKFPHWISQGNGCDTRDEVLKRDGKDVKTSASCKIGSGSWFSKYDGKTYTDPQKLDVDHMVPLADAWRSGAAKWTDEQRTQFANDLTRPQLLAVSLSTNRSKGDQDPSTWKPPSHDYWCEYAQRWVAVKAYWKLTISDAEKTALGDMLGTCK
jgi:hypothetical protein